MINLMSKYKGAGRAGKVVVLAALFCLTLPAAAQPAGNRVIEDTEVENMDGCSKITITFVLPVQYLSSFPASQGKELRVQFKPLVTDRETTPAVFGNEVVRLMGDPVVNVTRFEYSGEFFPDNPYLWLTFSDTVHFKVEQGSDFRSLTLFLAPNSVSDCE